MQKVVGSSPIIRSLQSPGNGAFVFTELESEGRCCKRYCKRERPQTSAPVSVWVS